jgi:hypothetical protein
MMMALAGLRGPALPREFSKFGRTSKNCGGPVIRTAEAAE